METASYLLYHLALNLLADDRKPLRLLVQENPILTSKHMHLITLCNRYRIPQSSDS